MNTITLNLGGNEYNFKYNHDFSNIGVNFLGYFYTFTVLNLECGTVVTKQDIQTIIENKIKNN